MDNEVDKIIKQIEENNQKLMAKCDECLELIRETKECTSDIDKVERIFIINDKVIKEKLNDIK